MKCPSPISVKDKRHWTDSKMISVPCGKCGACKSNRRADWSFRLSKELRDTLNSYFLTLTYDDEHLPFSESGLPELNKKHLQKFFKRIRKRNKVHWEHPLRYYAVGEYGTKTSRPHYHVLAYNLFPDLAKHIHGYWKHGNAHLGTVTASSIHYVTKFHVNTKNEEIYDERTGELLSRTGEFATMSRRPGIGAGYVDKTKSWHKTNQAGYVINNGYKQRLPRYYKEKIFDAPERHQLAKDHLENSDRQYWLEYARLSELGITNPDRYMHQSEYREAQKIKNKSINNDKF